MADIHCTLAELPARWNQSFPLAVDRLYAMMVEDMRYHLVKVRVWCIIAFRLKSAETGESRGNASGTYDLEATDVAQFGLKTPSR
jgi:hypothetical protein